jgi:lectin family protein
MTAAMVLLSARAWAAPPQTIVDLDFSKATDLAKVMINDPNGIPVQVVDDGGKKRLRLTDNTGEVSSVFIKTPVPPTADYLATFQFEIKNDGGDPADGFCFVAQTAGPDKIGGGGGSLGYVTSDFDKNSYAVEFNTYAGQGPQAVAWDYGGTRSKFDQTPFDMVDKGIFTAEVRVQPGSITVTISGGTANLKPTQAMTTNIFKTLGCGDTGTLFQRLTTQPIYFGFTAGTGGLGTIQDVLNLKIVSPAP